LALLVLGKSGTTYDALPSRLLARLQRAGPAAAAGMKAALIDACRPVYVCLSA